MSHTAIALLIAVPAAVSVGMFSDHTDIGKPDRAGNVEFDAGKNSYRVTGGGANIWGASDSFQFVYLKTSGDIDIAADLRLEGQSSEPHRKAALMIRQSLDPDSAYADIAIHGDGSAALQYRPGTGVATSEFRVAWRAPTYVRLERHGNEFSVMASDGLADKPGQSGPVIVSMSGLVYVGLAVCAHHSGGLEAATFRNVKLKAERAALSPPTLLQLVAEHSRVRLPLR